MPIFTNINYRNLGYDVGKSNGTITLVGGNGYQVPSEYIGKSAIVVETFWAHDGNQHSRTLSLGGLSNYTTHTLISSGWTNSSAYVGKLKSGTISITNTSTDKYSGANLLVFVVN